MKLALAVLALTLSSTSARARCKDELVVSTVRRVEPNTKTVVVSARDGSDALLSASEQVPNERYKPGVTIAVYCDESGTLTRRSPKLVEKLFALDVPEIAKGVVVVKAIAREPGVRTKIAVADTDGTTDPVAALVGPSGKIAMGVAGAVGEPIDIVPWSPDDAKFVTAAMAPAEITRIIIDEASHRMELIVPDANLPKAIGKRGINVQLAADLTGWRIDLHSASKVARVEKAAKQQLAALLRSARVGDRRSHAQLAEKLFKGGWRQPAALANAKVQELVAEAGIDEAAAKRLIEAAAKVKKPKPPSK